MMLYLKESLNFLTGLGSDYEVSENQDENKIKRNVKVTKKNKKKTLKKKKKKSFANTTKSNESNSLESSTVESNTEDFSNQSDQESINSSNEDDLEGDQKIINDTSPAEFYQYEINQIDDPQLIMINSIAKKLNLDPSEVAQCVDMMWHNNLPYDDESAVMRELQKEPVPVSNQVDNPSVTNTNSTSAKNASSSKAIPSEPSTHQIHPIQSSPHNETRPKRSSSENGESLTIRKRLEIVAKHSKVSLSEAISSLHSWATIILKTSEKEAYLKASEFFHSKALDILLDTIFNNTEQYLDSQPTKDAFTSFLCNILVLSPESNSNLIHYMVDSFDRFLQNLSSLQSMSEAPSSFKKNDVGLKSLASQIASCIKKLFFEFYADKNVDNTMESMLEKEKKNEELFQERVHALDKEIFKLQLSIGKESASHDSGASSSSAANNPLDPNDPKQLAKIQSLFSLRDSQFEKIRIYIQFIGAQMEAIEQFEQTKHKSSKSSLTHTKGHISKEVDITQKLMKSINESNRVLERDYLNKDTVPSNFPAPSQHQITKLVQEKDHTLKSLNNELHIMYNKKNELASRRVQLIQQLKLCDQEIESMDVKIAALEQRTTHMTQYYEQKIQPLQSSQEKKKLSQQVQSKLVSLLDSVRNFEMKFIDAILNHSIQFHNHGNRISFPKASHSGADSMENMNESIHLKENLKSFFDSFVLYVSSEAKCIDFLVRRISQAKASIEKLSKELQVYMDLSMTVTAENTDKEINKLKSEMEEDLESIRLLQDTLNQSLLSFSNIIQAKDTNREIVIPRSDLVSIIQNCKVVGIEPLGELVRLSNTVATDSANKKEAQTIEDSNATLRDKKDSPSVDEYTETKSLKEVEKVPADSSANKHETNPEDEIRSKLKWVSQALPPEDRTSTSHHSSDIDRSSSYSSKDERSILSLVNSHSNRNSSNRRSVGGYNNRRRQRRANAAPKALDTSEAILLIEKSSAAKSSLKTRVSDTQSSPSSSTNNIASTTANGVKSLLEIQREQEMEKIKSSK